MHQTTLSLHTASLLIKPLSPDGQLFLLSQLLTLKQQIVAFDIEFTAPEISLDFSNLTNTFAELRLGNLAPRSLLSFARATIVPRVVANMLDAKLELDTRLRAVITDLTTSTADRMTTSLVATAPRAAAATAVRAAIETQVPGLRAKLDEYIEDVRTKETLVGAAQDAVLGRYEEFFETHMVAVRAVGGAVRAKGKGREDEVWDVDMFADWATEVFAVGGGV